MRSVPSVLGPILVWDSDHLGQVLESGAFWDEQLKPYFDQADPSGWAIDVGASIGFLTRYLASRHPHVLAVEAHPQTCEALRANVVGLPVRVIEGVAYDRDASFELAPSSALGWSRDNLATCWNASSIAFTPAWNGPYRSVVLDREVTAATVSLIKVDAQGCDLRALRGLQQTITRCRPLIVFEFEEAASSWQGDVWEDYEQFFAKHRYTLKLVREDLRDYVATPLENA